MENASKALLIAAEILIGVLLLTLMAAIILAFTNYQTQIDENYTAKEISQFNIKFLVYEGKSDLTAQDVVTIYNLAEDYNSKFEGETVITVKLDGQKLTKQNLNQFTYLKGTLDNTTSSKSVQTYRIEEGNIKTNQATGKINEILINKN